MWAVVYGCVWFRMTAAEAVETSVTSTNINSLSQDYTNLDVHFSQIVTILETISDW